MLFWLFAFLLMVGLKAPKIFFPEAQPPLTLNPTPPLTLKPTNPPPPKFTNHKTLTLKPEALPKPETPLHQIS